MRILSGLAKRQGIKQTNFKPDLYLKISRVYLHYTHT